MKIDAHTHLGLESFIVKKIPDWKLRKPAFQVKMENSIKKLLANMDASGVAKSLAFPFPLEEVDSVQANTYVLKNALLHPSRIIPFSLLDDEPERWIDEGTRGFKQHFLLSPERFNSSEVYRAMEKSKLPLIAHFSTGKVLVEVAAILKIAPTLKLIIAHMGRQVPNTADGVLKLAKELRDETNVYFETSTVYVSDKIKASVDIVGIERIIFGSDFPFNSDIRTDSTTYEINTIKKSFNNKKDREMVFSENIERILKKE